MTHPTLGTLPIDLPTLLETRLLLQANSGAGKSHALRRILEQTATGVQQLVIDPDGEFATLRERFDYIVCAPSGADAIATPHTSAALATALWKAGTSAILDIYELKAHERILFVRRFLEALVNAPRVVWHPTLVAIDEVHMFAPQVGSAESLGAVIDLATRGRKRGLALLGATQRLSKLHKDVAAECLNKLIGRTGLDVDVKRATDELGLVARDATETLRNLEPGEFFAFGPALSRAVVRTKIGPVATTHPQSGQRAVVAPPPPSAKVKAQLAKIEGLQLEAQNELKTVSTLTAELTKLRRELTIAQKAQPAVQKVGHTDAQVQALVAAERAASQRELAKLTIPLAKIRDLVMGALGEGFDAMTRDAAPTTAAAAAPRGRTVPPRAAAATAAVRPAGSVGSLRAGAVRILQELAARYPAGYSRPQVGALTQFAHKGGTFTTYIGDLRRSGFIEERDGLAFATQAGIEALGDQVPTAPTSHADAMTLWRKALRAGAFAMLQAIVEAGSDGLTRDQVAAAVGMTASGGTFTTYLGDLRRNGLITERDKRCFANDILFPERA
jgi:hypothetical protein